MPLRLRQLPATALVLPRVASVAPLAIAAAAGLLVVGLAGGAGDGAVVLRTRLAAMFVAAASGALLDDTAAPTLASSPTSLAVRRSLRIVSVGLLVTAWWTLMLVVVGLRTTDLPAAALTRELVLLTALAVVGTLVAQRWRGDGNGGGAGGLLATGWFLLSFMPRLRWVPLPPDALDAGSAGRLTAVTIAAVAVALALSRDPAGGRHRARPRGAAGT